MSIAPNVGALSRYFNRVRLNPKLWHAREDVEGGLTKLPGGIGAAFERLGPHFKESIKAFWAPGPVVGGARLRLHGRDRRPRRARAAPRAARGARRRAAGRRALRDGQGQGLRARRGGRPGGHGEVARRQAQVDRQRRSRQGGASRRPAPSPRRRRTRKVFGEALVARVPPRRARDRDHRGDELRHRPEHPPEGELPDRYFDVGIAEQQAILFAAGLALQGCKPVAAIYSTFLQRAYDQIVHDVCLQKLNVVFAMDRAGLVGDDGPTHHGAFDIAYLRCLPNIVLMAPRDEAMLVHMLRTALRYDDGPVALRYPRGAGVGVAAAEPARRRSRSAPARSCARPAPAAPRRRVALLGYGTGVGKALEAADILAVARDRGHRRRRPLRQADRRRAGRPAGRRARAAGDRRGGRAGRRLRLGGLGDAVGRGDRARRRGSCASGCPTATSPTARRSCCTRRSASPPSGSPSACWPRSPSAAGSPSG